MTLDEFKLELVKFGYKVSSDGKSSFVTHTRYKKRNKEITIQKFDSDNYYNVYFGIERMSVDIEFKQHRTTNFKKTLQNILKFERKLQ